MTPEERAELIAAVLSDAGALWAIRTSKIRVAGPWVYDKSESRKVGGGWRFSSSGKKKVTVYPSRKLQEPEPYEFDIEYDRDGEVLYTDDEAYEMALASHEREKLIWKPWTYCLEGWEYGTVKYADTLEDAKAGADAELRKKGVLLLNEIFPLTDSPKRLTRLVLTTEEQ